MMKKWVALILGILLVFSLAAYRSETSEAENLETYEDIRLTIIEEATVKEAITTEPIEKTAEKNDNSILIAYFSRFGNTGYPDNIDASTSASIVIDNDTFGTTEYMARMIQENIGGNLHLIRTQESYPIDFDELRNQNHSEVNEKYLPTLMESNLNMSQYDTVFIGYPVWATDVPQAVLSFLNEYDLSDKTVIPFCTHDGYGAGSSYATITETSHVGETRDGLAIKAKDITFAKDTVKDWLSSIGMTVKDDTISTNDSMNITIAIGNVTLDGVIYDTALAQEIKEKMPLTVSMVGYGRREYYGGIDFTPKNIDGGQLNFENGDITYCSTNNTIAIFYAQTNRPNLTMKVIPIGKVTSELDIFDTINNSENITFSLSK